MKKKYLATRQVIDFIDQQSDVCQSEYITLVDRLENDGFLIEPFAKKIESGLFEMRIRRGRQVRVIYFYDSGDNVIGLLGFVKKTQKTPLREIRQARKLMLQWERGDYNE